MRDAAKKHPGAAGKPRGMPPLVSMVRGINVGGNRILRMERLKAIYEALGFKRIRTYLQSGNVVCESRSGDVRSLAAAVERRILADCGFEVTVDFRTEAQMAQAVAQNPLEGRPLVDPKFLHATFLVRGAGTPSLEGIALPLGPGERAVLVGDIVYVYCPNGYGTTKIHNGFFERKLGLAATTRNWQTVTNLERMARGEMPTK
jgi:uncharacterized protein (DUF1697 family)